MANIRYLAYCVIWSGNIIHTIQYLKTSTSVKVKIPLILNASYGSEKGPIELKARNGEKLSDYIGYPPSGIIANCLVSTTNPGNYLVFNRCNGIIYFYDEKLYIAPDHGDCKLFNNTNEYNSFGLVEEVTFEYEPQNSALDYTDLRSSTLPTTERVIQNVPVTCNIWESIEQYCDIEYWKDGNKGYITIPKILYPAKGVDYGATIRIVVADFDKYLI